MLEPCVLTLGFGREESVAIILDLSNSIHLKNIPSKIDRFSSNNYFWVQMVQFSLKANTHNIITRIHTMSL